MTDGATKGTRPSQLQNQAPASWCHTVTRHTPRPLRPGPSDLTPEDTRVTPAPPAPRATPPAFTSAPRLFYTSAPFTLQVTWQGHQPRGPIILPKERDLDQKNHQGRWANEMSPRREVCAFSSGRKPLGPFNF